MNWAKRRMKWEDDRKGFIIFESKRKGLNRYIVFIFLLLSGSGVMGQKEFVHSFMHYTRDNGMMSNQVNCSIQDSAGYLWIGTNDGLSRFDGTRYLNFRHDEKDSKSISFNQVTQLLIDKKKNLWLLMNDGSTGIFNTKDFTFHPAVVKPHDPLSLKVTLKKLIDDEYGNLMLLYGASELLTYNEAKNEFDPKYNFIDYKKEWKIYDIIQQPGTRNYWLGSPIIGLALYNDSTKQLSYHGNNADKQKIIDEFYTESSVNYFLFDKKGRFWFCAYDTNYSYIYCYDFPNHKPLLKRHDFISLFKGFYDIEGFMEQEDGTVWFAGYKILGRYLEQEKDFEIIRAGSTHEQSIDYRFISDLYEDREKNIWVTTGNNGMFRFNPSQEFFRNIAHSNRKTGQEEGDATPISFFRDLDGSVIIGTWSEGLYRFNSHFKEIPLDIKGLNDASDYVYDMHRMADSNTAWFGAQPGLFIYNQRERAVKYYNPVPFKNETVRMIGQDKNGTIWVGVRKNGIFKWEPKKGKIHFDDGFKRYDSIPRVEIQGIISDKNGMLWIATAAAGLYVINPDNDQIIMHFDSKAAPAFNIGEENVTYLMKYDDTLMAIATASKLFFYNFNQNKVSLVSKSSFSGDLSSMEKDSQGRIWLATTAALYRVVPGGKLLLSFDRNNGILNDYFIIGSSYKGPDNTMAFGSSARIVVFHPDKIKLSNTKADIHITGLHLVSRSLSVDSVLHLKQLKLGPTDNSLTIDFSTLTHTENDAIQYQLEGLDKSMRSADFNRQLVYSYLPPGTYTLKFNVYNSEGLARENMVKLIIVVEPHFWQTWWFFSIICLVFSAIIYWIDRQRTQRIKKEQQMRVSLADNLHEDINTTLRNINVLSEIAAMKSASEPDQAKEYLKDIQYKSRTMVVVMNDMLWSIDPENDSMDKTVERFEEIAAEFSARTESLIYVQRSGGISGVRMNMKNRLGLLSVFKLVLELLVQRLEAKETLVHLDCENRFLLLKIFSKNITLGKNDGTIGQVLDRIRSGTDELNAVMNVHSDAEGTGFELKVRT